MDFSATLNQPQRFTATLTVPGTTGGGMADPTTTKGDLIARGPTPPATRLPVGSDGQILLADSSQALGIRWAPAPPTAGTGGPIVAAYNIGALPPGTPASWNLITWDANLFDTSGGVMHTTSINTSRFTATANGYYQIHCGLTLVGGYAFYAKLRLNGTDDVMGSAVGMAGDNTLRPSFILSAFVFMHAGDYMEALYNPSAADAPTHGIAWNASRLQFVKLFSVTALSWDQIQGKWDEIQGGIDQIGGAPQ